MSNILKFPRKNVAAEQVNSCCKVSSAQAVWRGGAVTGCGAISVASAEPADKPYSFMARLASGNSTNPEELLAAAHASCFTRSLASVLQAAGHMPTELSTKAVVTLEPDGAGVRVTVAALTVRARIENLSKAAFEAFAWHAEQRSAISNVLGAQITLDAALI
ncbi:MAG: OsmC family peroxiredoxin [Gammaproteobacteria bacterium]|nr:OsmC family peroxiredoxin [Gammaproteobacteria bacterium]